MASFWPTVMLLVTLAGTGGCWLGGQPQGPLGIANPALTQAPALETLAVGEDADQNLVVLPGQQVGPVTAQTSRADLAALYGEDALQDSDIHMGEGFYEMGTAVNPGSAQQFVVIWQDASRDRPEQIRDFGPAWRTPEGLGVGVPYAQVKSTLGDFQIYGFGWDYGGTVMLDNSQLDQYSSYLRLRLKPAEGAADAHNEAFGTVLGDDLFPSNNPAFDQLDLTVDTMVVYFTAI